MKSIRELRENRGMQQKELAIALNVSQPTVSDWEAGRKTPSGKSLIKLAQFFGISVEELTSDTMEPTQPVQPIVTNSDIKFALFGDPAADITDEEFEDIKRFAQFLREKRKHDK